MYDDDYLDDIYDEAVDEFNDFMDDYKRQLNDLNDQGRDLKSNYDLQKQQIDEYWDREDQYIRDSGIYTEVEIKQILEEHNEARSSQKEDAKAAYEMEK